MLYLKKISLFQFKNYGSNSWEFTEAVTGICGPNGTGKTNLLDAIYYLCFTKSYFARQDTFSVQQGKKGMRLEGLFENNNQFFETVAILRENNKKEFLLDQETYKKFSEHIGRFPCVMIAPDDAAIVVGLSEERRRLIDTILSQYNATYLEALIQYNKLLQQRNSLLKQIADTGQHDITLLEAIDTQFVYYGSIIYQHRKKFTTEFIPKILENYQLIAGSDDGISISYISQLNENSFKDLLKASLQKDMLLQRTNSGIHKDDLEITMQENSFKNRASQGQRKTLLLAIKLAEFSVLKEQKKVAPIMLLDDVFEKLDEQRMHQLFYIVCVQENCQVFITDTHAERLSNYLKKMQVNFSLITL
ncbi:MAG: DNA replication and repair protein RecF [Sphingobacteriales bacterium]|uniref:DNA replication/repair protein RecF n=1 Tax=Hydrotalea flava TaxID=714549 RepID=UPI00082AF94B|nr:DNA replication and repair protein RecF [Hydrotalea flava]RTL56773.1 MAG: DNA replication and repair protein RecF [Sphingobacteriales bacterium]